MPKSSSTSRTPSSLSAATLRAVEGETSSSAVSVTSSESAPGGRPLRSSAAATVLTRPGSAIWRGDRFTDVQPGPAAAATQACSITHEPIGTISPDSSATGMKSAGASAAARPPRRQRSSASWPTLRAVAERDDRLEDELELAAVERALEVGLRAHARDRAAAQPLVEDLDVAAARLLGAVGGGVGVGDEPLRVRVGAAAERDPDAGGDPVLGAVDLQRLLHRGRDAPAEPERDALVDVLADDHELVAAEPRDRVGRAHGGREPARERDQHRVAGGVAVEVVDALEVVDVDVEHRGAGARALGVRERVLEPVAAERAVGQPRQRVVQRLVADALLRAQARVGRGEHVGDRDEERALLLRRRACRRP